MKTETTVTRKNEYGGKTVESILSPDEVEYKQEFYKTLFYYDSNGKVVKDEAYSTDEHARKGGLSKKIFYYDSNGKKIKTELYSTDERARTEGFSKMIDYFDSNGKMVTTEAYYTHEHVRTGLFKVIFYYDSNEKRVKGELCYTDEYARTKGVSKAISYYNSNGKVVKMERYDKEGNIFEEIKEHFGGNRLSKLLFFASWFILGLLVKSVFSRWAWEYTVACAIAWLCTSYLSYRLAGGRRNPAIYIDKNKPENGEILTGENIKNSVIPKDHMPIHTWQGKLFDWFICIQVVLTCAGLLAAILIPAFGSKEPKASLVAILFTLFLVFMYGLFSFIVASGVRRFRRWTWWITIILLPLVTLYFTQLIIVGIIERSATKTILWLILTLLTIIWIRYFFVRRGDFK